MSGHDLGDGATLPPDASFYPPCQGGGAAEVAEVDGTVDQYRILRVLGRGGMGVVYLAVDALLGRRVALKVMDPAICGMGAEDRFLIEAQATARFSHPNIVTIYGTGRIGRRLYVALEYLPGQTLRERLLERRMGLRDALRVGLAIARALEEAHTHGVLHRDLKPENVMLPRDGRLRVVDFGLARLVEAPPEATATAEQRLAEFPINPGSSLAAHVRGTPLYMAPEQWEPGREQGPAVDVWAFGLVLHEVLAGRHPIKAGNAWALAMQVVSGEPIELDDAEIPPNVLPLLRACLAKDPGARPTMRAVAEGLEEVLADGQLPRLEEDGPFRGLLPMDERHAGLFFGRTPEIEAFQERIRHEPIVAVVGPSGAGKSSFVMAGVIPRLREQDRWIVLQMRPGRQPLRAMAARLQAGGTSLAFSGSTAPTSGGPKQIPGAVPMPLEDVEGLLREAPGRLGLWLDELARRNNARVLLLVDQLEELYTQVESESDRTTFMGALCAAVPDGSAPVRVILTLRDDFLGRLAGGVAAQSALASVFALGTPGPEALAEILTRSAAVAGFAFDDPGLPRTMAVEVAGERAALPLLQVAGQTLWQARDKANRKLRRAIYDETGGVAGALAFHADGVLAGVGPGAEGLARQLLLRLVAEEGGVLVRRVVQRSELLRGLGEGAEGVLDLLVRGRLVLVRKARGEGTEAEIEMVHESLIGRWRRLAAWVEAGREDLVFLSEAQQAANLWVRRGRPASELWAGEALHDARRKAARIPGLPEAVVTFLDAGQHRERLRARQRRALGAGALVVTTGVAVVMGLLALQAGRARDHAASQRAEALLKAAELSAAKGERLAACAYLRSSLEIEDSVDGRALWWALQREPLEWKVDLGTLALSVDFSAARREIAVGTNDGAVLVFDPGSRVLDIFREHEAPVMSVAFSPDGRLLASGSIGGRLVIRDLADRSTRVVTSGPGEVYDLEFDPAGQVLAAAGSDEQVRLWDPRTGERLHELRGHKVKTRSVAIDPAGRRLASVSRGGEIFIWDLATGTFQRALGPLAGSVVTVDFSPDGRSLVTGGAGGGAQVWDVERGELRAALRGHTQIVLSATFSPDGARIATSAQDGLVLVWDAATGAEVLRFADHEGWVSALAFSPDGRRIMSVGFDATARLHSVAATHARPPAHGPAGPVSGVAYSPDGALVATADWEGAVRLWDAVDGSERAVLEGHEGSISRLVFDSTGSRLASAGHDGTARLWDVASQTQVAVFQSGGAALFDARISPDGARLATAGANGEVVLWDIAGGGRLATVTRGVLPMALAFDRLGARLAAGWADGGILLYDGVTLAPRQVLASTEGALCALDFSADGRALASAGFDQPLRVYDLAAGTARVLYEVPGTGFVSAVAFAPGDGRIAWTSNGGQIWVRDLTSALTRTWDAHTREINALAWSPDGAWIASASDDGTVGLDEAATGLPRWFATGLSERPEGAWTHRGWQGLGEEGTPAGSTAWEKAVEGARRAAASSDGGRVCLQEPGGQVALWDARLDRALGRWEASPLADLFALPDACVGRSREGQVRAFAADAAPRTLATAASALAIEGPVALIADAEGARGIDRHGEEHVRVAATPGATAILRIGDTWLLGYPDGRLERFAPGATDPAATRLDAAPASAIRRLAAGPNGDVLVGFDSGDLGLWRIEDGHRLLRGKLHGPITHLARRSGPVLALSERGDVASLDVREFTQGWCEVLHDVWAQVPEVWEGGRVQTRGAGGHRCAGE